MKTLTPRQFAERVGIHRRTALVWARSGRIRATKTASGRWLIPASEADAEKRARISPKEFAARAGVCYRTAVRWAAAGKLDAVQSGPNAVWAISAREVERVRQEREEESHADHSE